MCQNTRKKRCMQTEVRDSNFTILPCACSFSLHGKPQSPLKLNSCCLTAFSHSGQSFVKLCFIPRDVISVLSPPVNEEGHHSVSLFLLSRLKPKGKKAVCSHYICSAEGLTAAKSFPLHLLKYCSAKVLSALFLALFPPFLLIRS